jgi:hypothetical protein
METFEYTVKMTVQVDAFDESDAWDALQDAFGIGESFGVTVTDCEYQENRKRKK